MSNRTPISKTQRFEVFKRDAFTCQYCGAHPPNCILEVDHIEPVSNGGTNDQDNLVTACFDCNRGKGARLLASAPKSLAEKTAMAIEREEQLRGYTDVMMAIRERIEDEAWTVAEVLKPGASDGWNRSYFESVKRFVNELGVSECLKAADMARSRKPYSDSQRFKYFCGICWNLIRGPKE